ncbi:hypothetical protein Taro_008952 [Colocasia esculenta]|uniref:Uncharacterized protein n=1 Tax=Colocasia esculenta TaxID=4460 RepID=A0A843U514_COLES|nr:hypothetical protein [Colocasia esculenta]
MSVLKLAAQKADSGAEGKTVVRTVALSHLQSSRGWSGTPRTVRSSTRRRPASPVSHCLAPCGPRTAWRGETSQQRQGTRLAEETGRLSGSPDPWAATAKIGSSAWAEGRVLESLHLFFSTSFGGRREFVGSLWCAWRLGIMRGNNCFVGSTSWGELEGTTRFEFPLGFFDVLRGLDGPRKRPRAVSAAGSR